jgi:hypothetical protein
MILTQEFLDIAGVCTEGQQVAIDGAYIGWDYDEVIKDLVKNGKNEDAGWMLFHKKTETYVRFNAKEVTMGSYQVFNTITGTHIEYKTEEEAKVGILEIAKQILEQNKISVCRSLSNENGDSTWIPIELETPYDVVLKT